MEEVSIYNSQSKVYEDAFKVFLQHTNQKTTMDNKLQNIILNLNHKNDFIDVGAGEGVVTHFLSQFFQNTIAIEPNPFLSQQLHSTVPQATIIEKMIMEATPPALGDFVLCSHTFYYIDKKQWLINLERITSWTKPEGVTVVVLQNKNTDCMKMLQYFLHEHFDLSELFTLFKEKHAKNYSAKIECVEAEINVADLESAYTIAEFMLNLLPIKKSTIKKRTGKLYYKKFSNQQWFSFYL